MLRRITINNFRSIDTLEVEIPNVGGSGLGVLIGPNGTGKSNILDAVLFVRDLLLVGAEAFNPDRRGALRPGAALSGEDLCWKGRDAPAPMMFSLELDVPGAEGLVRGTYTVTVGSSGLVRDESLIVWGADGREEILLEAETAQGGWAVDAKGQRVPLGSQTRQPALARCNLEAGFPRIAPFYHEIAAIRGHAFLPALMRASNIVDQPRPLETHGENLSGVLLSLKTEHEPAFRELLFYLREHLPEIKELRTPILENQRTRFVTEEVGILAPISANLASDGMLSLLGLIVIALQPFPSPCVVIEEPEAHLHQGLMGLVADLLRFLGRRSSVLVATHSPRLVKELEPGHILVAEKKGGATKLRRLDPDAEGLRGALEEMDLGEAWMNGFFGGLPMIGRGSGDDADW